MKNKISAWALAVALLAPFGVGAAPVLSITPSVQSANVGDSVQVAVSISGLGAVPNDQIVSAFDLDVVYGTSLLSQSGAAAFQAEALMGGAGLVDFDTLGTGPGLAAANAFSFASDAALAALQPDSFALFTVTFTAMTDGAAFLDFGSSPLFSRLVVGRSGQALDLTYNGACVSIGTGSCGTAVPEPASLALAALALLSAAGATRARRRGASAA